MLSSSYDPESGLLILILILITVRPAVAVIRGAAAVQEQVCRFLERLLWLLLSHKPTTTSSFKKTMTKTKTNAKTNEDTKTRLWPQWLLLSHKPTLISSFLVIQQKEKGKDKKKYTDKYKDKA